MRPSLSECKTCQLQDVVCLQEPSRAAPTMTRESVMTTNMTTDTRTTRARALKGKSFGLSRPS